ncbi:MAG TPA: oligogalacturonate lyase family protein [Phycisphaerae bacterium]|nr:oligogalacturonate lyase family protein [Phycisphaerae bacterium]
MRRALLLCSALALASPAFAQQSQPAPASAAQGRDPNTGQAFAIPAATEPAPKEWIDKDTGHRVVRLSDEPNSQSMYFHQYSFSPDGKKLAFTSTTGIYQVDLASRAIEKILDAQEKSGTDSFNNSIIMVGRKTGHIFYTHSQVGAGAAQPGGAAVSPDRGTAPRTVWWIDPVSRQRHKIGDLPENHNVSAVNCDETMLAGAVLYLDGRGGAATQPVTARGGQRIDIGARWAQHLPMALLTMDAKTGALKTFNPSNDWDNHFQFSPTDPNLLMYCHEGPWQNNDRVWTINTDGTNLFKVHSRTMINEIWGHEFWSPDGTTSWYQLHYPRGTGASYWIAGTNLKTKQQTWYHIKDEEISIHVNISNDGKLFAGDGIGQNPWIFLHTPHIARDVSTPGTYDTTGLIQPGYCTTEKLVNMSKHQYALEPNPIFTPDNKWIIFRSNMFGPSYVFAVEVAKAQ